jgi:hypothetical protein
MTILRLAPLLGQRRFAASRPYRYYDVSASRAFSSARGQVERIEDDTEDLSDEDKALQDASYRQRRTEWKRRQRVRVPARDWRRRTHLPLQGQVFLDYVVISVRGGHSLAFLFAFPSDDSFVR